MKRWLRALPLLVLLMSSRSSAQAESLETARLEASAHFRQGVELFREGAFRAALIELERAYEVYPDYRVLYNIAQTELRLGEFVEARWAFECYLAKGGPNVDEERRKDVESQIKALEERTARIAISVNQQGAQVYLDGTLVGTAPLPQTFPLSVGRHRVFAMGDDGASATQIIELAGGDFRDVTLQLGTAPRAPKVALKAEVAPLPPDSARAAQERALRLSVEPVQAPPETVLSRRQRWGIGLLVAGAGVGMGAAAVGLGLEPRAHDAYQRARREGDSARVAAARQAFDRYELATDSLVAGAVALGMGGAILVILGDDDAPQAGERRVNVGLTPRSVSVHSTF
jgi:tetratricopeptide (TPR) repeat protein